MNVEFFRHQLGEHELAAIRSVFDGVFLTSGPFVARFEAAFAQFLKVEQCVAVSSCSSALLLALRALGIGAGDDVLVPAITFAATANAVWLAGARPVFCDVCPHTGLTDPKHLEQAATPATKAVIAVHLYGHMAAMPEIAGLAAARGWRVIEDAAHCIEGSLDSHRPGQHSDAAAFSFYATKNLTSGEGGAVVTRDRGLAERIRTLRNHGMSRSSFSGRDAPYQHWELGEPGMNAKLSELHAAILLAQLPELSTRAARRAEIVAHYDRRFDEHRIRRPIIRAGCRSAHHLYTIWAGPRTRDQVLQRLHARGIGVGVHYRAVHTLAFYRTALGYQRGTLLAAEALGDATLSIPLYPALSDREIEHVVDSVVATFAELEP